MQSAYYDYKRGELTEEDMEHCNKKGMELIYSMSKTIDAFRNFFLPNKEKELFRVETAIGSSIELVEAPFAEISIKIEKHHNGEILATNNEQNGATFTIRLLLELGTKE